MIYRISTMFKSVGTILLLINYAFDRLAKYYLFDDIYELRTTYNKIVTSNSLEWQTHLIDLEGNICMDFIEIIRLVL